jgi:threonine/homoserine/homoserine lactone efflux protein
MLATLMAFTAASVLIILFPGPDTLVVLRGLIRGGRREAALTAGGVMTGLCLWVVAAAFGLAAVLRASEAGYTALKLVGAVYLVWLGIQSLRQRLTSAHEVTVETEQPREGRRMLLGTGYAAGLMTNLLNPKIGVFFVTFLPGFIPDGESVVATSLLLGAIFVGLGAAYFAVLLSVAARVIAWLTNPRVRRRLDRATGVVLIGFGLRLATEP